VGGLFFPVLNACVVTVRTMRTPVSLRPTVHTAAVTVAMILAPLGALAAGPALESFDLAPVLAVILLGNTVCGLAITAAGLRDRASAVEETALVVDREHEAPGTGVAPGVTRRRD